MIPVAIPTCPAPAIVGLMPTPLTGVTAVFDGSVPVLIVIAIMLGLGIAGMAASAYRVRTAPRGVTSGVVAHAVGA